MKNILSTNVFGRFIAHARVIGWTRRACRQVVITTRSPIVNHNRKVSQTFSKKFDSNMPDKIQRFSEASNMNEATTAWDEIRPPRSQGLSSGPLSHSFLRHFCPLPPEKGIWKLNTNEKKRGWSSGEYIYIFFSNIFKGKVFIQQGVTNCGFRKLLRYNLNRNWIALSSLIVRSRFLVEKLSSVYLCC